MNKLLEEGFYDFLHDGLSIYYALLENQLIKLDKEQMITRVFDYLDATAIKGNDAMKWTDIDLKPKSSFWARIILDWLMEFVA